MIGKGMGRLARVGCGGRVPNKRRLRPCHVH